jgi:hypothetical protein
MASPPQRLTTLLARLAESGTEFVLVGGLAAVAQGAPLATVDVGVVPRREPANVERLLAFLDAVDARYRGRALPWPRARAGPPSHPGGPARRRPPPACDPARPARRAGDRRGRARRGRPSTTLPVRVRPFTGLLRWCPILDLAFRISPALPPRRGGFPPCVRPHASRSCAS